MLVLITNKQLRWVVTGYVQQLLSSAINNEHKDSVDIRFFFPFYEKRCDRIQNLNPVYSIIIKEDIVIKRTKNQTKTLIHIRLPEHAVSHATC